MLKQTTIFLNPQHQRQLAVIGKAYGGLTTSAMTRLAIAQFLSRERRKQAAHVVVPTRKNRSAVLLGE